MYLMYGKHFIYRSKQCTTRAHDRSDPDGADQRGTSKRLFSVLNLLRTVLSEVVSLLGHICCPPRSSGKCFSFNAPRDTYRSTFLSRGQEASFTKTS